MGERNECVEASLAELERFGLKGVVGERGKHLEVSWEYPDGRSRFVIVARTASDRRAVLNCRGEVRRQLRADNIELPSPKVVLLQKAFSLPKPAVAPDTRIVRLETDIEGLLDLVADLQAKVAEQAARLNNIRVTTSLSFDAPQQTTQVVLEPRQPSAHGSRRKGILEALNSGSWRSRNDIAAEVHADVKLVSACLSNLREEGLVENGQRGMWRKKLMPLMVVEAV